MTLYNVNVNIIQTTKKDLGNQWFGAPISQFFVKLDQKWVQFWKLIEEIRTKLNLKYELKTIQSNIKLVKLFVFYHFPTYKLFYYF